MGTETNYFVETTYIRSEAKDFWCGGCAKRGYAAGSRLPL
jgi:hypothetical protein